MGREKVFASLDEANRILNELRAGIEQANELSPGLMERSAYVEKTQDDIRERLARELERRRVNDAASFVDVLIDGERVFSGDLRIVTARLSPVRPVSSERSTLTRCSTASTRTGFGTTIDGGVICTRVRPSEARRF